MLNQPIIGYGELLPQEISDLLTQARALKDFKPEAQKRIHFAEEWAICGPEPDGVLVRVIRQGIEDGRVLRKVRYCEIDYDTGSGGVREYVCLWDDEPDIDNWRGKPQNPYTDILPGD